MANVAKLIREFLGNQRGDLNVGDSLQILDDCGKHRTPFAQQRRRHIEAESAGANAFVYKDAHGPRLPRRVCQLLTNPERKRGDSNVPRLCALFLRMLALSPRLRSGLVSRSGAATLGSPSHSI